MSTNTEDLVIGEGDVAKAQELHQRGMAAEAEGDRIAAIEAYRESVAESPLTESRFRLAWLLDLMGEEEEALSLYQSLAADDQPHINALVNLAIMLEDRGEYDEAMRTMLRPVLESDPNHPRARMFQRDCEASESMLFDEDTERDQGRFNTMLDTPVTDFELSVRAKRLSQEDEYPHLGRSLESQRSRVAFLPKFRRDQLGGNQKYAGEQRIAVGTRGRWATSSQPQRRVRRTQRFGARSCVEQAHLKPGSFGAGSESTSTSWHRHHW